MTSSKLISNLRSFRLITFDVTDTLLKFRMSPTLQYAKTASEFGYSNINQLNLETSFREEFKYMMKNYPNFGKEVGMEWKDWWRKLVRKIFTNADTNIPDQELLKISEKLIEQYRTEECWYTINGAHELVRKIKEIDKIVGIISNFDPSLHDVITKMNLPKFDFILTSYEAGALKPNPAIFQRALDYCDVNRNEALHIGNTLSLDYLGASNAGWSSVHISNKSTEWKNCNLVNENHVFESLKTFLNHIETENMKW